MLTISLFVLTMNGAMGSTQSSAPKTMLRDGNQPPSVPLLLGPHAGAPAFELMFTANATDPDGDQVLFKFDWGDGNSSDWLGPVNSTENIVTLNYWDEIGNYTIHVRVKDSLGLEQNDSLSFNISIAPQITITNLQSGYVYIGQTFFYVGVFYLIGAIAIASTATNMTVNVSASPNVTSVVSTLTSIRSGNSTNITDDNATDGYQLVIPIKSGLYQLLFLAYDADGNLIDGYLFNFVLYWQFGTMNASQAALLAHHSQLKARIFK